MKKSLAFYRSLPEKEVSAQNGERFAVVHTGNLMLCLYYGRYDMENPAKVSCKGERVKRFDDYAKIAKRNGNGKTAINSGADDLRREYERISALGIADN